MDRKEQIQRAKELLECGVLSESTCDAIKADFPELAESEDERIRKWLIELIKSTDTNHSNMKLSENCKLALAYLEKQKVQPTDTKTEQVIKAARRVLNNWLDDTACPDVSGDFAELEYAIREYDGEEKQKVQKGSLRVIKDASEWEKIKEQKSAEWSEEQPEVEEAAEKELLYEKVCYVDDWGYLCPFEDMDRNFYVGRYVEDEEGELPEKIIIQIRKK